MNRHRGNQPARRIQPVIAREQIEEVLKHARLIGDKSLAACASRALDGDSVYHASMLKRCAKHYALYLNLAPKVRR